MREIRNLHPDPRCTRIRETWRATGMRAGEKYRYELADGEPFGSVHCWHPMARSDMAGKVLYARITSNVPAVIDNLFIERASTIATADTWIAARVADNDTTNNHTINVTAGPYVLQEVGVYTPEDWEQLYSLYQKGDITYPWVAGPRDAQAGQVGLWEL